jgi:hypothetical protein
MPDLHQYDADFRLWLGEAYMPMCCTMKRENGSRYWAISRFSSDIGNETAAALIYTAAAQAWAKVRAASFTRMEPPAQAEHFESLDALHAAAKAGKGGKHG